MRASVIDQATGIASLPRMRLVQIPGGRNRGRLLIATASLLLVAGALVADAAPSTIEPDLARLLRFMAVLKGAFGVIALAASFWRLARPAARWRTAAYVFGPGLVGAGAIGLGALQAAGLATLVLHAGLFAVLAAALTDPDFVPSARERRSAAGRRSRVSPPA